MKLTKLATLLLFSSAVTQAAITIDLVDHENSIYESTATSCIPSYGHGDQAYGYTISHDAWNMQDVLSASQCYTAIVNSQGFVREARFEWDMKKTRDSVVSYPSIKMQRLPSLEPGKTVNASDYPDVVVTGTAVTHCTKDCKFDTGFDIWFKKVGSTLPRDTEIMILTESNVDLGVNFFTPTVLIGGNKFRVVHVPCLIIPTRPGQCIINTHYVAVDPINVLNVHVRDFVKDALSRGYVGKDEYTSGIEFGTEVLNGKGSLVILNYQVKVAQ